MKIMKIQNNIQTPSFGELIKTPEARVAIKRCKDLQTINKLVQAQKDMAGTEYFDIVLGKDLKCKIRSLKEAFFGVFESPKYSNIRHGVNEDILELGEYTVARHSLYKNDDEYGYNVWNNQEHEDIENAEHIETLVSIAKELDKAAIASEKRTLSESIEKQILNKAKLELLG